MLSYEEIQNIRNNRVSEFARVWDNTEERDIDISNIGEEDIKENKRIVYKEDVANGRFIEDNGKNLRFGTFRDMFASDITSKYGEYYLKDADVFVYKTFTLILGSNIIMVKNPIARMKYSVNRNMKKRKEVGVRCYDVYKDSNSNGILEFNYKLLILTTNRIKFEISDGFGREEKYSYEPYFILTRGNEIKIIVNGIDNTDFEVY